MDQERTYKWIQERLRELHSGTLSEQDFARLKEIARTDPFVADALEGFHAHPNGEHARHLHLIEQKIKQPKRERRRWLIPNLTVTAIAASVLVIIATYAVISRIQKENEETLFVFVSPDSLSTADTVVSDLAMEENSRNTGETQVEKPTSGIASAPGEKTNQAIPDKKESKPQPVPADKSDHKAMVTEAQPKTTEVSPPAPAGVALSADDVASPAEDIAIASKTELARSKKDEGFYANQMDPDLMQSRVTGRVVDAETGVPLAAKLIVNFSNQVFYTDGQGNFELSIPEQEAVLQASVSGFVDSTIVIRRGDENIGIGLRTGALIPVQGLAGAKNKGPITSLPDPAIASHLQFSSYLNANALLQLTTEPSSARRKVTVEFKVRKDGHPTDITVLETSRDKTYDGEAVRLIKDGPEWVCPGGEYPCMRRYTFYFR